MYVGSHLQTIEDVKNLIMYNNWQSDPLSFGFPQEAIAARTDLGKF
jgi:hypothetical protein